MTVLDYHPQHKINIHESILTSTIRWVNKYVGKKGQLVHSEEFQSVKEEKNEGDTHHQADNTVATVVDKVHQWTLKLVVEAWGEAICLKVFINYEGENSNFTVGETINSTLAKWPSSVSITSNWRVGTML